MQHKRVTVLFVLAFLIRLVGTVQLSAQDWPRFRGPNGSGISHDTTIPVQWTNNDYSWRIELPGVGHSSPVVWGRRLFVTSADAATDERYLLCINTLDGTIEWTRTFAFSKYKKHKNNSYASNTPAVDAERVYVLWQSPSGSPLISFDHTGQQNWKFDLGEYRHGQGSGTSPIVHDELVVVSNDHKQGSFLLAVDRRTGQQRWKIPREGQRACFSTPCVFQLTGRPAEIVFTHCFEGIVGIDPRTGKQNWMIDVFGRFSQRAVGSPVVAGEMVIANSGAAAGERNVVAIRPYATAADHSVQEVYRISKTAPHVPTPLVYGEWMFLWNDRGVVTCVRADSGQMVWQKRVGGNYFGSPICINGRLYSVDLDGTVVVLSASDNYELLARNPLGNPSRATPAVSGGKLFIRSYSHLYAIGKNGTAQSTP